MKWIPEEIRKRGRPNKTLLESVYATMKSRKLKETNGRIQRNGDWASEDGDSYYNTGHI